MMNLDIARMKPEERMYAYNQSQQIMGQTGCIGHLRGDFGKGGSDFYTTWEDHVRDYRAEEFSDEFDKVVNALRAEGGCGLFVSRDSMERFCHNHSEAGFEGNYCTEYGFKLKTMQHIYLLRCNPNQGDYNFYLYVYVSRLLDRHMEKAEQGVRFITPNYKEIFRIPDGDKIQITLSDGEKLLRTCRFIDETHLEVGSDIYHICEFAERMEKAGSTVIPMRSSLPGKCFSVLPSTGELIILAHGETDYTHSGMGIEGKTSQEAADIANDTIGVTKAQEAAMLAGSLFGWETPAADPRNYDENGAPKTPAKKKNKDYER